MTVMEESQRPLVLVMDDQEEVRVSLGFLLQTIGCRVILTIDCDEAILRYREMQYSQTPVNIALLDVNHPTGKGAAAAIAQLIKIDPEIRAIAISGQPNEPLITHFRSFGFAASLVKPFCIGTLRATIANILLEDS